MHRAEGDALAPQRQESCWQPLEQGLTAPCSCGSAFLSRAPTDSWAPRGTGEPLSLPGQLPVEPSSARAQPLLAWSTVTRGEREHSQNTQSRQVLPIHQPFLPTSPLCPDSGSQGHPGVPPQGSSPSPKQPWEKPCQAGFSVDSTLFQNPGQSTEM